MKLVTDKKFIDFIGSALEEYNEIWVHGDGNIFENEYRSNIRKDFSSPSKPETMYVLKFKKGDVLPKDPSELYNMFIKSKSDADNFQEPILVEQKGIKPKKKI